MNFESMKLLDMNLDFLILCNNSKINQLSLVKYLKCEVYNID